MARKIGLRFRQGERLVEVFGGERGHQDPTWSRRPRRVSFKAGRGCGKREEPMKTSTYPARGKAQGSVNQFSDKIDKNMTIEQVREILNKSR